MHNRIIQDGFQRYYRLYTPDEVPARIAIQARSFRDPILTEQFVRGLRVPSDYWQPIVMRYGHWNFDPNTSSESRISQMLLRGQLKLYPLGHIKPGVMAGSTQSFPAMNTGMGKTYQLIPASVLLVSPSHKIKTFASKQDAEAFLAGFSLDAKSLTPLLDASDLPGLAGEKDPTKQQAQLIQALLAGKLVIIEVQQSVAPPKEGKAEELPAQRPGNKPATLGPHAGRGTEDRISNTNEPTTKEVGLAKSPGSSPEQIAARKKVAKAFYSSEPSLGEKRYKQEIKGIDLSQPVEVVEFPPPDTMQQYVRETHQKPGNFFDPVGGQSADSLGISDEGRVQKTFKTPKGKGLISTSAPIEDKWTNPDNPVMCDGGGKQVVVGSETKNAFKPV